MAEGLAPISSSRIAAGDTGLHPRTELKLHLVEALPDVLVPVACLADEIRAHEVARIAARPGLRVPGGWDGFELTVRAILGQQITVRAATKLAGKLVGAYGVSLADAGTVEGLTHAFPSPKGLANADLAALGMTKSRAIRLSASQTTPPIGAQTANRTTIASELTRT